MELHVTAFVWVLVLASITPAVAGWARLPYSVALVAVGLLVGSFGLLQDLKPSGDTILLVLLPPLLFEAALNLDIRGIGQAMPVILLLAIPGVAISAVLVGVPLAWLTPLTIWPALLFGAFIAATDPVAVVTTFRRLKAPLELTCMIEGESLFNDGTALVFSTLLITAARTGQFHIGETMSLFLWSVIGGTIIGGIAGYVISEATRLVDDHLIEITLSGALAYGAYLGANHVQASGALAVVAAGIVYAAHGRQKHMTDATGRILDDVWEYIGFLANATLFILIGVSASLGSLKSQFGWVVLAIAVVLIARAFMVYTLTLGLHRITLSYGHILFWGGLRGGVALAVALSLPSTIPHHSLILTMTFGVVLFTILVQGITIKPLASRLNILAPHQSTE